MKKKTKFCLKSLILMQSSSLRTSSLNNVFFLIPFLFLSHSFLIPFSFLFHSFLLIPFYFLNYFNILKDVKDLFVKGGPIKAKKEFSKLMDAKAATAEELIKNVYNNYQKFIDTSQQISRNHLFFLFLKIKL